MCFDWFKKLRLFVNERNLKIDVVLKASGAVVIRWFSLKRHIWGYFNLFPIICLIFQYHDKQIWINL